MCRAQGGGSLEDERSLAGAEGETEVSSLVRGHQGVPQPPSLPLLLETSPDAIRLHPPAGVSFGVAVSALACSRGGENPSEQLF